MEKIDRDWSARPVPCDPDGPVVKWMDDAEKEIYRQQAENEKLDESLEAAAYRIGHLAAQVERMDQALTEIMAITENMSGFTYYNVHEIAKSARAK